MTETLSYKGLRSTRMMILIAITLAVTGAYVFFDVSADQWIDFLKWAFGIYAASEVGAKGANAYAIKNGY